jgi:hypothetical protein
LDEQVETIMADEADKANRLGLQGKKSVKNSGSFFILLHLLLMAVSQ